MLLTDTSPEVKAESPLRPGCGQHWSVQGKGENFLLIAESRLEWVSI